MLILKHKEVKDMKKKIFQIIITSILFFVFVMGTLLIFVDRNEKIENGEIIQISEEYMR